MGRRISTTVYLDPEQIRDLRALAESTRVPMAALIRDAIDEYLWDRRLEVPVRGDDPHQAPLPLPGSGPRLRRRHRPQGG